MVGPVQQSDVGRRLNSDSRLLIPRDSIALLSRIAMLLTSGHIELYGRAFPLRFQFFYCNDDGGGFFVGFHVGGSGCVGTQPQAAPVFGFQRSQGDKQQEEHKEHGSVHCFKISEFSNHHIITSSHHHIIESSHRLLPFSVVIRQSSVNLDVSLSDFCCTWQSKKIHSALV